MPGLLPADGDPRSSGHATQVAFFRNVQDLPVTYPDDLEAEELSWDTFPAGLITLLILHFGGHKQFGPDAPKFVFPVVQLDDFRNRLIAHTVTVSEIRTGVVADCCNFSLSLW